MSEPNIGDQYESELLDEHEVREPKKYRVLLHNDDYTTMDFVVEVLVRVFRKSETEATIIMLQIHNEGVGVCGLYTAEVAETKVDMVHRLAKSAGYPLRCTMEGE
ncbi:ATP-dependent Clp protease adapter ClpS [Pseudodesulfovibrio senegalensis]|jgi:ATP-dependent Clp protease adaptor protein ClpS|uniref:ATP-dependent Clp protease adapter protein ClpS n=1 Tax=Pseudodesulfovibrio senegalensis TaxID=1721087 RepID=A0A6N6N0W2_9BACT|nr:ATP-dependent Clp protease adapter ClpS [Pseudodesulfovibrio senegalensis]KAB1441205.1 ATP-dependent Clp protease adapter ClpS [Pseudodesulfovibrio senegalensis]